MPQMSVPAFVEKKKRGEKIAMLTAYDYSFARCFDEAGVDVLLVGDSLGNVVQGYDTTLNVTLDEMVYHKLAEQEASMSENVNKVNSTIPAGIFVG